MDNQIGNYRLIAEIGSGGQEQTLRVSTKFFALVALLEQVVKVPRVGFQRLGRGGDL